MRTFYIKLVLTILLFKFSFSENLIFKNVLSLFDLLTYKRVAIIILITLKKC